jgi:hypothetical protein
MDRNGKTPSVHDIDSRNKQDAAQKVTGDGVKEPILRCSKVEVTQWRRLPF